jgi:hypothetical protein
VVRGERVAVRIARRAARRSGRKRSRQQLGERGRRTTRGR